MTVQWGTLVSRSGTEGRRGVWERHWHGLPRGKHEGGEVRGAASAQKRGVLSTLTWIVLRSWTSVGAEARFLLGPPTPPTAGAGATSKLRRPKTNF